MIEDPSLDFELEYSLENGTTVCERHFLHAYGIYGEDMEACSEALKENPDCRVLPFKDWDDDYLPNYSHDQIKDIFSANLPNAG